MPGVIGERSLERLDRTLHRAAGCILVPAAPETLSDGSDIDVALRSQADAIFVAGDLLEEDHRPDLVDRERHVHQTFGVVVGAASPAGHRVIQIQRGDVGRRVDFHGGHHHADETQSTETNAVVQLSRHAHRIHTGFERLSADLERARRNARIVKRSGVGQDPHVDMGGDLQRERHAERLHEVEHHLGAGRRGGVEPVHLPVSRVARMVIDVDDEEPLEPGDAGPTKVAALHDDRPIEIIRDAVGELDLRDPRKGLHGVGRRILVDDANFLAERPKGIRHGQLRPNRVAVGPGMRGNEEAPPGADGVDNLPEFVIARRAWGRGDRRRHGCPSRAARCDPVRRSNRRR